MFVFSPGEWETSCTYTWIQTSAAGLETFNLTHLLVLKLYFVGLSRTSDALFYTKILTIDMDYTGNLLKIINELIIISVRQTI